MKRAKHPPPEITFGFHPMMGQDVLLVTYGERRIAVQTLGVNLQADGRVFYQRFLHPILLMLART